MSASHLHLPDDSPTTPTGSISSTSSIPHPDVSDAEATFYYAGLCSSPRLIYRTGTTPWMKPTGPEAQRQLKELRPVFGHKLSSAWGVLGPKLCQLLDSQGVLWTSIDVVWFAKVREAPGPVILWIGAAPKTLSSMSAWASAIGCLDLLKAFEISDVEVEYRESIYAQSAGPILLKHVAGMHPTADVCSPLTPALGLPIAHLATPHFQGTGGLYLAEGGESKKVLLLTARHVLLPSNGGSNNNYTYPNISAPQCKVILLGTGSYTKLIGSIKDKIDNCIFLVGLYERQLKKLRERLAGEDEQDVAEAAQELRQTRLLWTMIGEAADILERLHAEVMEEWSWPAQRVIGHVTWSPPITLGGMEGFTEDYAIIELNMSKFKKAFVGNVIDLGIVIPPQVFTRKMYPRTDAGSTFKYPDDRLHRLRGIIPEDLMHKPDMLDHDGEPCLLVIKNGSASGTTIGRATGIFSFTRAYFNDTSPQTSMEWAGILPYDNESGSFCDRGDSGSIIADGLGRIGGLLTGGSGKTASLDITYATPFFWLFPRIKENGYPSAHLYPAMD